MTKPRSEMTEKQIRAKRESDRRAYERSHPGCPPYVPGSPGRRRLPDQERAARKAKAVYESAFRHRRARWLFLANQIPGCLTPVKCKACHQWTRPEERNSARRCRLCARANGHLRRARERNAPGKFTAVDWISVLDCYDNRCAHCGVGGKMTMDHIIPLSLGGSNYPSNLQPLCSTVQHAQGRHPHRIHAAPDCPYLRSRLTPTPIYGP